MKPRLLLISNSTQYGQGFLDHCADQIRDFLGGGGKVVFIPYAAHDWDGYTAKVRARLAQIGVAVTGVHEGLPRPNCLEAEAFFCGGGNTFRLLSRVWEQGLVEAIRKRVEAGAPYIGSSAGTNLACPTIKTTNDMPIVQPPTFEALGLVPFNINCHYLDPDPNSRHQGETREDRIREFHEMNSPPVLGLREGAWLRREGEQLRLEGSSGARLFRAGEPAKDIPAREDLSFLLSG